MHLTLKNFKTLLSATLLKKAKSFVVRECDEIKPGHFQAYVDVKENTFDTSLQLKDHLEVIAHGCDCEDSTIFCPHKAALLLFLVEQKKPASPLKLIKKVNQLDTLLNNAEDHQLRAWVFNLLSKNKDLELLFINEFNPVKLPSPAEINASTKDIVKAVVNRRQKVEIAELKRIIQLWTEIHQNIIDDYCEHCYDEPAFLRLHAIFHAVDEIQRKLRTSSIRVSSYQNDILETIFPFVSQIEEEQHWDQVVTFFAERIKGDGYYLRMYYLNFLVKLHGLSSEERRRKLTITVFNQYHQLNPDSINLGDQYTDQVLQ
ncbi:hypothetical protein, partial [Pedobacter sp.]|uniref:hypothetical protein n=1 Tax=Pedobacter sp. TaxID=1411316 RepID=UPI003D7FD5D5